MNPTSHSPVRMLRRLAVAAFGFVVFAGGSLAATTPKIGVLLKGTSAFWSAVEQGCRDAAQRAGAEIVVRKPATESDIAGQIRLLDELGAAGISALVIAPCSSTDLADPVAALAARGVKVVVIDSPLDLDMPAYIATNHTDAGTAAGKLVGSLVHDDDEVAILRHSKTGGATLLRESSAYAAIYGAHPGHIIVHRDIYNGTVPGKEIVQALLLLKKYPATKAILASGTPGTMAMLQALEQTGLAGKIKFVGFGFNLNPTVAAALESGAMSGWIAQLPGDVGGRGVNAALALLRGEHVPEVTFCDFLVITKANLHEPSVQALLPVKPAAQ